MGQLKLIQIKDLFPGMIFDSPVYIEKDTLFIPAGVPVHQKDIKRLEKWEIPAVMTKGSVISEQSADSPDSESTQSGLWFLPIDSKANALYHDWVARLSVMFSHIQSQEKVNTRDIDTLAYQVSEAVQKKPVPFLRLVFHRESKETMSLPEKYAFSALNSALTTLSLALEFKHTEKTLTDLATAALLHDTGMLRLPKVLLNKKSSLSDPEKKLISQHPLLSYQVIKKELGYPERLGQIALQHHERWDGCGYPQKQGGKEILLEARILSITDAFEAMMGNRPYRDLMIAYSAVKTILSDNGRKFDPDILKVFIKSIGVYPIGSFVLLNDSSIAVVESLNPSTPIRPVLRIVVDSQGNEYGPESNPPLLNLAGEKSLFIIKAIDINSLKKEKEN